MRNFPIYESSRLSSFKPDNLYIVSFIKSKLLLFSVACLMTYSVSAQGQGQSQTIWKTNGNTASTSDRLGTNNSQNLLIRTNGIDHVALTTDGKLGVGILIPQEKIHIIGNGILTENLNIGKNLLVGETIQGKDGQFERVIPGKIILGALSEIQGNMNLLGAGFIRDLLNVGVISTPPGQEMLKVHGKGKIFGDFSISGNLELGGDAMISGNVIATQLKSNTDIIFGGDKKISFLPTFGNQPDIITFGTGSLFDPGDETDMPCVTPYLYNVARKNLFTGTVRTNGIFQSYGLNAAGEKNVVSMGFDGVNGFMDVAGINSTSPNSPALLLNYYCGKDVYVGNGTNGDLFVNQNISVSKDATVNGILTVSGDVNFTGNFTTSNLTLTNTLTLNQAHILDQLEIGNSILLGGGGSIGNGNNDNNIYTDDADMIIQGSIAGQPTYSYNTILNTNGGNVGIGTTSAPTSKLEISDGTDAFKFYPGIDGDFQASCSLRPHFGSDDITRNRASDFTIFYGPKGDEKPRFKIATDGSTHLVMGGGNLTIGSFSSGANAEHSNVMMDGCLAIGHSNSKSFNEYFNLPIAQIGNDDGGDCSRLISIEGASSGTSNGAGIVLHDPGYSMNLPNTFGIKAGNGAGRLISNGGISLFIDADDNETTQAFDVVHNSTHYDGTNAVSLFTVKEDGNVLVKGSVDAQGYKVNGVQLSTKWIDAANGSYVNDGINIGIGTSAPTARLHIKSIYPGIALEHTGGAKLITNHGDYLGHHFSTIESNGDLNLTATGGRNVNIGGQEVNMNNKVNVGDIWGYNIGDGNKLNVGGSIGASSLNLTGNITAKKISADDISIYDGATKNILLAGNGQIIARSYIATVDVIPDYVFEKGYKLMPLYEVDAFVKKNHHLPGVKSNKEVVNSGLNMTELQLMQLEKIEELYLHAIQSKKDNEKLQSDNIALHKEIEELKKLIKKQK